MRNLIVLGLCACVTATAAAQTEVIIRSPGRQDQVISLDSTRRIAEMRATIDSIVRRQEKTIEALRGRTKLMMDTLYTKTLALQSGDLAAKARTGFVRLESNLAAMAQQPHLGVWVDTRPRDSDKYGAYVQLVTPGSPAARAGIVAGDVITKVAGKSLTDMKSDNPEESGPGMRLIAIISKLQTGKTIEVELRRGNDTKTVKVTPVEDNTMTLATRVPGSPLMFGDVPFDVRGSAVPMPSRAFAPGSNLQMFTENGPGGSFAYAFGTSNLFANYELAPMNEKLGSYFGTSEGVLVVNTVSERSLMIRSYTDRDDSMTVRLRGDSIATKAIAGAGVARSRADTFDERGMRTGNQLGLEPGDVIVSIDGRKVNSPSQLMRIVASYDRGDSFKLQYMRQKRAESVDVKMP
ncbi:MAG: PDZ domain-containing protein [Gemmatimonadales bacterium]